MSNALDARRWGAAFGTGLVVGVSLPFLWLYAQDLWHGSEPVSGIGMLLAVAVVLGTLVLTALPGGRRFGAGLVTGACVAGFAIFCWLVWSLAHWS